MAKVTQRMRPSKAKKLKENKRIARSGERTARHKYQGKLKTIDPFELYMGNIKPRNVWRNFN